MKRDLPIVLLILVVACVGCSLSSADEGSETRVGATEVGTPVGERVSKSIGPSGGELRSSDGRVAITVPADAVAAPTEFSIQPITNNAQAGLGNAYRLEPTGQFSVPVDVSFQLEAKELEGSTPEALTVAYQDSGGMWQALADTDFDNGSRMLTVKTSHFTDFTVWTFKVSPEKATLRVGESLGLGIIGCIREGGITNRFRRLVGMDPARCPTPSLDYSEWSATAGTIEPNGRSALYTAPARRPSPNVVTVRLKYRLRGSPNGADVFDVRTAEITIVDNAYTASGSAGGDTVFSGVICDIGRPFRLKTSNPFLSEFEFTPGTSTNGTWAFVTKNGVVGGGRKTYQLEGTDELKTAIVIDGVSSACVRVKCGEGQGEVRLKLTPLDTNECAGR